MLCGRTLKEIVDHLACSLNDNEGSELKRIARKNCNYDPDGDGNPDGPDFEYEECEDELNNIRWSKRFLINTINDALRILRMERPDLFTRRHTHTLMEDCRVQSLTLLDTADIDGDGDTAEEICAKFAGDMRNVKGDCDEEPVQLLSDRQLRPAEKLSKLFCPPCEDDETTWCATGYSFNPEKPHEFIISPKPPAGAQVTFNVVDPAPCFNYTDDTELTALLDEEVAVCNLDDYEPWIIEYALFRAHMTDRESESSVAVARIHWDTGMKLIGNGKQADYTFYHPDLYLLGPIAEGTGERIILQPE